MPEEPDTFMIIPPPSALKIEEPDKIRETAANDQFLSSNFDSVG